VHLAPAIHPVGVDEFEYLAELGVRWIAQTPFAGADTDTPRIQLEGHPRGWWGERELGILALAQAARGHGIATLLKPHLWVDRSWPGAIRMQGERDWRLWFERYEALLVRWARWAEAAGIEGLCIGSELDASLAHEAEWRHLIRAVRSVYGGLLTYNANWSHFEEVPFWDELDAIGVSAWFPLTGEPRPSLESLVARWQPIRARLARCAERVGRPVLFTEIGYLPREGAFLRPWEHDSTRAPLAPECQATGYEAIARVFFDEPWFAGAIFWEWRLVEERPPGWDRLPSTPLDGGYSPRGRPAEEVLRRVFRGDLGLPRPAAGERIPRP